MKINLASVLVDDQDKALLFYTEVLGFRVLPMAPERFRGAAFLQAPGSINDHDLGLFGVGADAPGPEQGRVGLYHLAWQVGTINDLVTARDDLQRVGAYVGESDHGATKSIYGKDPDGNEFEIMWMVPREQWTADDADTATIAHLDLAAEVAKHG